MHDRPRVTSIYPATISSYSYVWPIVAHLLLQEDRLPGVGSVAALLRSRLAGGPGTGLLLTLHLPAQRQPVKPGAEQVDLASPALALISPGHAAHHPHVALPRVSRQPGQLSPGDVEDAHMAVILRDGYHAATADG